MRDSGSLDGMVSALSPQLSAALGLQELASPAGFLNGNLYALLLPLLFGVLGIMLANALTAGDEDAGRLELLLALPVSRVSVYAARFAAVAVMILVIALLVGATVSLGGSALGMELDRAGIAAATVGMLLLALFHAALALALAGLGLPSGTVFAVSFAVLLLGYLAYALLPLVASTADLGTVSPWHWALGGQPLVNGFKDMGIAQLAGGTVVLAAAGLTAIGRRTIRNA